MIDYQKIAGKPNLLRSFTALPEDALDKLIPVFATAENQKPSARTPSRQRQPGGGRKPVLSTVADRLLFILFYFKFYPTQQVLGFFFGISQGQANHWIHRLTPVLNTALGYQMQLPARKSASVAAGPNWPSTPSRVSSTTSSPSSTSTIGGMSG